MSKYSPSEAHRAMPELLETIVHGVLHLFGVAAEADDSPEWQNVVAVVLVTVSLVIVAVMTWLHWPW